MRIILLIVAAFLCQSNALAKQPTYRTGVISSAVSATTSNGLNIKLIPGEVVQIKGGEHGDNLSVKSASLDEYVEVPAEVIVMPLHTSPRLAELSGVAGALDKDGYLLQAQP